MPANFRSAQEIGLPETAALLNRGFADYLVPLQFTADSLSAMARSDQIDFAASRVIHDGDQAAGVALIARRGSTCRLAGMALTPEARGHGLGRALLEQTLVDAHKRGDTTMVLEVINQNETAQKLYRSAGFEPIRQLLSFERGATHDSDPGPTTNVDLNDFTAAARAEEASDLPWQISAATLTNVDPARHSVVQVDGLSVLVAHVGEDLNAVRGLVGADREGASTALRQVLSMWPQHRWRVPALFPETWSPCFLDAGFTPGDLSQTQMVKRL